MFEAFKSSKTNVSAEGLSVKEKGFLFYELNEKKEPSTKEIADTIPTLGKKKTVIREVSFGKCRDMSILFSDQGTKETLENSKAHTGLMRFDEDRPDGVSVSVESVTGASKWARTNAGHDILYDTGEFVFNKISKIGSGVNSEARCRLTLEFAIQSKEIAAIQKSINGSASEK